MPILFILLSLLVSALISVAFFTRIVRFLTEQVGHYLRRSSRTRRELLLARVATETKNHEAEHAEIEDYDWEDIASVATGNKKSSGTADKQWDGIVGFFHPFW
jgi:alpha-1,2-mannosyltransferase